MRQKTGLLQQDCTDYGKELSLLWISLSVTVGGCSVVNMKIRSRIAVLTSRLHTRSETKLLDKIITNQCSSCLPSNCLYISAVCMETDQSGYHFTHGGQSIRIAFQHKAAPQTTTLHFTMELIQHLTCTM